MIALAERLALHYRADLGDEHPRPERHQEDKQRLRSVCGYIATAMPLVDWSWSEGVLMNSTI